MAVYERTYNPYEGAITPPRMRFLVLPKYAFKDIFSSKLFIAFLVACFIGPLFIAVSIYVTNNLKFIEFFKALTQDQLQFQVGAGWYRLGLMVTQTILAFLMALLIGPSLVSRDMRNNAMPLYLSRPFTRTEYILGKGAVLVIMLSAITWIPGLTLFALQSYMQGFGWMADNWRIAFGVIGASAIVILTLATVSLAISAYMKWKTLAQAALFGVILLTAAVGNIVNVVFRTEWGSFFNIGHVAVQVSASLFGADVPRDIPDAAAWLSVILFNAFFLAVLWRKVQAYEVVR
jgi:ABC-2 type transport system permease protein